MVLGLITSKFPVLEDKEAVKARIKEATKYVPLNQLALSPQCGFSSTEEGNILTEEAQWAKVRLVVEIAKEVWLIRFKAKGGRNGRLQAAEPGLRPAFLCGFSLSTH